MPFPSRKNSGTAIVSLFSKPLPRRYHSTDPKQIMTMKNNNASEKENIFKNLPISMADESFEAIINTENILVERIVSWGHSSPPNFWYDQDKDEWILLLQGRACIKFQKGNKKIVLNSGDHLTIPAHAKHRVEWTDAEGQTIWLAMHYRG